MSGPPQVGRLVRDMKRDRLGVVMDVLGTRMWLRPRRGGREWMADARDVRPASALDQLRPARPRDLR